MKNSNTGRLGFTLIELLVVVLIVGILAAVALPQYQNAVIKGKLAAIKPMVFSLKKAEESFFLANGKYTKDVSALDLEHGCNSIYYQGDVFSCGTDFFIDLLESNEPKISVYYCPGMDETDGSWQSCWSAKQQFKYIVWLTHSDFPDKQECAGNSTIGAQICREFE